MQRVKFFPGRPPGGQVSMPGLAFLAVGPDSVEGTSTRLLFAELVDALRDAVLACDPDGIAEAQERFMLFLGVMAEPEAELDCSRFGGDDGSVN